MGRDLTVVDERADSLRPSETRYRSSIPARSTAPPAGSRGDAVQTITINNAAHGDATEATVFGPFFVEDSPRVDIGGDISLGAAGVEGTVTDVDGNPVPGARIDVWEADEDGFYDVQYDDKRTGGRAHLFAGDDGRYAFWGLTPTPYPIPHDGPVGRMLAATGRSPMRASHLHFMVTAPDIARW